MWSRSLLGLKNEAPVIEMCEAKLDQIYNHRLKGEGSFFPDPPNSQFIYSNNKSILNPHPCLHFNGNPNDLWLLFDDSEILINREKLIRASKKPLDDRERVVKEKTPVEEVKQHEAAFKSIPQHVGSPQKSKLGFLKPEADDGDALMNVSLSRNEIKEAVTTPEEKSLPSFKSEKIEKKSIPSGTRTADYEEEGHFHRGNDLIASDIQGKQKSQERKRSRSKEQRRSRSRERGRSRSRERGRSRSRERRRSRSRERRRSRSRERRRSRSREKRRRSRSRDNQRKGRTSPGRKSLSPRSKRDVYSVGVVKKGDIKKVEGSDKGKEKREALLKNFADQLRASSEQKTKKTDSKQLSSVRLQSRVEDTKQRRAPLVAPISFKLKKPESGEKIILTGPIKPKVPRKEVEKPHDSAVDKKTLEIKKLEESIAETAKKLKNKLMPGGEADPAPTVAAPAVSSAALSLPSHVTSVSLPSMAVPPPVITTSSIAPESTFIGSETTGYEHLAGAAMEYAMHVNSFAVNPGLIPGQMMIDPAMGSQPGMVSHLPPGHPMAPQLGLPPGHLMRAPPGHMLGPHQIPPPGLHIGPHPSHLMGPPPGHSMAPPPGHPMGPPPGSTMVPPGHPMGPPPGHQIGPNHLMGPPPGHPRGPPLHVPPPMAVGPPPRIAFGQLGSMPAPMHQHPPPIQPQVWPPVERPPLNHPVTHIQSAPPVEILPPGVGVPQPVPPPKAVPPPGAYKSEPKVAPASQVVYTKPPVIVQDSKSVYIEPPKMKINNYEKIEFFSSELQKYQHNSELREDIDKLSRGIRPAQGNYVIKHGLFCKQSTTSSSSILYIVVPSDPKIRQLIVTTFMSKYPLWDLDCLTEFLSESFINLTIEDIEEAFESGPPDEGESTELSKRSQDREEIRDPLSSQLNSDEGSASVGSSTNVESNQAIALQPTLSKEIPSDTAVINTIEEMGSTRVSPGNAETAAVAVELSSEDNSAPDDVSCPEKEQLPPIKADSPVQHMVTETSKPSNMAGVEEVETAKPGLDAQREICVVPDGNATEPQTVTISVRTIEMINSLTTESTALPNAASDKTKPVEMDEPVKGLNKEGDISIQDLKIEVGCSVKGELTCEKKETLSQEEFDILPTTSTTDPIKPTIPEKINDDRTNDLSEAASKNEVKSDNVTLVEASEEGQLELTTVKTELSSELIHEESSTNKILAAIEQNAVDIEEVESKDGKTIKTGEPSEPNISDETVTTCSESVDLLSAPTVDLAPMVVVAEESYPKELKSDESAAVVKEELVVAESPLDKTEDVLTPIETLSSCKKVEISASSASPCEIEPVDLEKSQKDEAVVTPAEEKSLKDDADVVAGELENHVSSFPTVEAECLDLTPSTPEEKPKEDAEVSSSVHGETLTLMLACDEGDVTESKDATSSEVPNLTIVAEIPSAERAIEETEASLEDAAENTDLVSSSGTIDDSIDCTAAQASLISVETGKVDADDGAANKREELTPDTIKEETMSLVDSAAVTEVEPVEEGQRTPSREDATVCDVSCGGTSLDEVEKTLDVEECKNENASTSKPVVAQLKSISSQLGEETPAVCGVPISCTALDEIEKSVDVGEGNGKSEIASASGTMGSSTQSTKEVVAVSDVLSVVASEEVEMSMDVKEDSGVSEIASTSKKVPPKSISTQSAEEVVAVSDFSSVVASEEVEKSVSVEGDSVKIDIVSTSEPVVASLKGISTQPRSASDEVKMSMGVEGGSGESEIASTSKTVTPKGISTQSAEEVVSVSDFSSVVASEEVEKSVGVEGGDSVKIEIASTSEPVVASLKLISTQPGSASDDVEKSTDVERGSGESEIASSSETVPPKGISTHSAKGMSSSVVASKDAQKSVDVEGGSSKEESTPISEPVMVPLPVVSTQSSEEPLAVSGLSPDDIASKRIDKSVDVEGGSSKEESAPTSEPVVAPLPNFAPQPAMTSLPKAKETSEQAPAKPGKRFASLDEIIMACQLDSSSGNISFVNYDKLSFFSDRLKEIQCSSELLPLINELKSAGSGPLNQYVLLNGLLGKMKGPISNEAYIVLVKSTLVYREIVSALSEQYPDLDFSEFMSIIDSSFHYINPKEVDSLTEFLQKAAKASKYKAFIDKCTIINEKLISITHFHILQSQKLCPKLSQAWAENARGDVSGSYIKKKDLICTIAPGSAFSLKVVAPRTLLNEFITVIRILHSNYHDKSVDELKALITETFDELDFELYDIERTISVCTICTLKKCRATLKIPVLSSLPHKLLLKMRQLQMSSNVFKAQIELLSHGQSRAGGRYFMQNNILCRTIEVDGKNIYRVAIPPSKLDDLLTLIHAEYHRKTMDEFFDFVNEFMVVTKESCSSAYSRCFKCGKNPNPSGRSDVQPPGLGGSSKCEKMKYPKWMYEQGLVGSDEHKNTVKAVEKEFGHGSFALLWNVYSSLHDVEEVKKWQENCKVTSNIIKSIKTASASVKHNYKNYWVYDDILFIVAFNRRRSLPKFRVVAKFLPNVQNLLITKIHAKHHDWSNDKLLQYINSTFDVSTTMDGVISAIQLFCDLCNKSRTYQDFTRRKNARILMDSQLEDFYSSIADSDAKSPQSSDESRKEKKLLKKLLISVLQLPQEAQDLLHNAQIHNEESAAKIRKLVLQPTVLANHRYVMSLLCERVVLDNFNCWRVVVPTQSLTDVLMTLHKKFYVDQPMDQFHEFFNEIIVVDVDTVVQVFAKCGCKEHPRLGTGELIGVQFDALKRRLGDIGNVCEDVKVWQSQYKPYARLKEAIEKSGGNRWLSSYLFEGILFRLAIKKHSTLLRIMVRDIPNSAELLIKSLHSHCHRFRANQVVGVVTFSFDIVVTTEQVESAFTSMCEKCKNYYDHLVRKKRKPKTLVDDAKIDNSVNKQKTEVREDSVSDSKVQKKKNKESIRKNQKESGGSTESSSRDVQKVESTKESEEKIEDTSLLEDPPKGVRLLEKLCDQVIEENSRSPAPPSPAVVDSGVPVAGCSKDQPKVLKRRKPGPLGKTKLNMCKVVLTRCEIPADWQDDPVIENRSSPTESLREDKDETSEDSGSDSFKSSKYKNSKRRRILLLEDSDEDVADDSNKKDSPPISSVQEKRSDGNLNPAKADQSVDHSQRAVEELKDDTLSVQMSCDDGREEKPNIEKPLVQKEKKSNEPESESSIDVEPTEESKKTSGPSKGSKKSKTVKTPKTASLAAGKSASEQEPTLQNVDVSHLEKSLVRFVESVEKGTRKVGRKRKLTSEKSGEGTSTAEVDELKFGKDLKKSKSEDEDPLGVTAPDQPDKTLADIVNAIEKGSSRRVTRARKTAVTASTKQAEEPGECDPSKTKRKKAKGEDKIREHSSASEVRPTKKVGRKRKEPSESSPAEPEVSTKTAVDAGYSDSLPTSSKRMKAEQGSQEKSETLVDHDLPRSPNPDQEPESGGSCIEIKQLGEETTDSSSPPDDKCSQLATAPDNSDPSSKSSSELPEEILKKNE